MPRPRIVIVVAATVLALATGIGAPPAADAGQSPDLRDGTIEKLGSLESLALLMTTGRPATLTNLRINTDSNPPERQFDPSVAASVRNPDVAVVGYTDRSQAGIQLAYTHNGGAHWVASQFTGQDKRGAAPCSTFEPKLAYSRRDRAFYATFVCFNAGSGAAEIQLIKSTDDGATWTGARSSSLVVANHAPGDPATIDPSVSPDWPAVAVDNTPTSPHYGRIYTGYVRFHAVAPDFTTLDSCPAHVAYTDQVPTVVPAGATWTDAPVMPRGSATDASAAGQMRLTVDDRGGVDVVFANEDCNSFRDFGISFTRSANGGQSYPAARHITRPAFFRDNPDPDDVLEGKDLIALISPSIAFNPVDRSLGIVYHNFRHALSSASDISYQRSNDRGAHWKPAQTISVRRDGRPAQNDQFLPWITADPATGFLHALWFDNRRDRNNRLIETFQAFSRNGTSWRNANVSTASWDPSMGRPGTPFAGNVNSIAAAGDRIYPVWGDARDPGPIDQGHGGLDIFTNVERRGSPASP